MKFKFWLLLVFYNVYGMESGNSRLPFFDPQFYNGQLISIKDLETMDLNNPEELQALKNSIKTRAAEKEKRPKVRQSMEFLDRNRSSTHHTVSIQEISITQDMDQTPVSLTNSNSNTSNMHSSVTMETPEELILPARPNIINPRYSRLLLSTDNDNKSFLLSTASILGLTAFCKSSLKTKLAIASAICVGLYIYKKYLANKMAVKAENSQEPKKHLDPKEMLNKFFKLKLTNINPLKIFKNL